MSRVTVKLLDYTWRRLHSTGDAHSRESTRARRYSPLHHTQEEDPAIRRPGISVTILATFVAIIASLACQPDTAEDAAAEADMDAQHTVEGSASPIDLHFVHAAAEGDLAVIGVFLEAGEADPTIQSIWDAISPAGESPGALAAFDPRALLPEGGSRYRYPVR